MIGSLLAAILKALLQYSWSFLIRILNGAWNAILEISAAIYRTVLHPVGAFLFAALSFLALMTAIFVVGTTLIEGATAGTMIGPSIPSESELTPISEIKSNPNSYMNQSVTIRGYIVDSTTGTHVEGKENTSLVLGPTCSTLIPSNQYVISGTIQQRSQSLVSDSEFQLQCESDFYTGKDKVKSVALDILRYASFIISPV